MKPSKFKYQNKTLRSAADDIESLPVWTDGEQCISLWKMSLRERLSALLFGRVWVSVMSGQTQPPIWAMAAKEMFEENET